MTRASISPRAIQDEKILINVKEAAWMLSLPEHAIRQAVTAGGRVLCACALGDSVAVMDNGRIVHTGRMADLAALRVATRRSLPSAHDGPARAGAARAPDRRISPVRDNRRGSRNSPHRWSVRWPKPGGSPRRSCPDAACRRW